MAGYNYNTLQANCLQATVKAQPPTYTPPADFANLFPRALEYAEARICRDIILLATRTQDTSLATTAFNRAINLSAMTSNQVIVVEGLSLITPAGTANPAIGTRVPYDMASLDLVDQLWPVEGTVVTPSISDWNPRLWAMRDDHTIVYCPTADAAYTAEITGLFQPVSLSVGSGTQTTYLSTVYPDLLFQATMIFLTGPLLHNWGAQAGDPAQAMSYEGEYMRLMESAKLEEERRRGIAPDAPQRQAPQQQRAA